jgi:hypothetical protein
MSGTEDCPFQVRLTGGPHDGRVAGFDDVWPGTTIVMHRIPDDGPMVRDLYLCVADGEKLVGNFLHTEAIPEPVVWPNPFTGRPEAPQWPADTRR